MSAPIPEDHHLAAEGSHDVVKIAGAIASILATIAAFVNGWRASKARSAGPPSKLPPVDPPIDLQERLAEAEEEIYRLRDQVATQGAWIMHQQNRQDECRYHPPRSTPSPGEAGSR